MNDGSEKKYRYIMDIAYLASCAIRRKVPEAARMADMDLKTLYKEADRHMMSGITAMALESAGVYDESFTQAKGKAVRKVTALDLDRAAVMNRLEEERIWYMPLKGSVLKDFYPRTGMRQMSDNDILYDPERSEDVRNIMEDLGFTTVHFGMGVHDVYHKQPVSRFEMHRRLFGPKNRNEFTEYYRNVGDRLLNDNSKQYARHFSAEDFYCYMIAHEYKHYSIKGTGLRSLMDTWVYLEQMGDSLDWQYIHTELGKLGIDVFEQKNRQLAQHLFREFEVTKEDQRMLEYISSSGSFGTLDHRVQNGLEKYGGDFRGKLSYLWSRVMPPIAVVEEYYPVFYRHRLLLPFFPLFYLKKKWPRRKKVIKEELKLVIKSRNGN